MKFDADVGSIIYVLDSKTHALVPMLVIEEITKRVLGSTEPERQHIVRNAAGKSYIVEEMASPVFNDLESARSFLTETAEKLINMTVVKAQSEAEANFSEAPRRATGDQGRRDDIIVDLGNGQKAKLNIHLPNGILDESSSY